MTLKQYQNKVEETWIKGNIDEFRIVLGIVGEAGEIAEAYKKFLRGDYLEGFNRKVERELGDLSYYIAKLCNELGVDWSDILEMNIKKLRDRQKRGKLRGSGDNR